MPKRKHHDHAIRYDDKHLNRIFPHWVPLLYGAACLVLIPWTVWLAYLLPPRYQSHHWDIAWTGFDIFLVVTFALTAWLAVKKSSWTALSATILGTVLLTDAWFDVLTAKPGREQRDALIESVIELVLATLSYALAHRIFNEVRHHTIKP